MTATASGGEWRDRKYRRRRRGGARPRKKGRVVKFKGSIHRCALVETVSPLHCTLQDSTVILWNKPTMHVIHSKNEGLWSNSSHNNNYNDNKTLNACCTNFGKGQKSRGWASGERGRGVGSRQEKLPLSRRPWGALAFFRLIRLERS